VAPSLAASDPVPLPEAEAPAPTIAETEPAPAAQARSEGPGIWPWLIAALLGIGALALFARRRRRRALDEESTYVHEQPVAVAEPVIHQPTEPASVAAPAAMAAAPLHEAPVAASSSTGGRPWIELLMRPVRAGVGDDGAVVEFELEVDNRGSVTARDVQISTWMLAAGSPQESEMERMLIDPPADCRFPEVTIDPGNGKRIEAAVALPTAGLHDSILPVVVADARYRLPDGSEGRTSASFAVGVPMGGELAHFDVENPSGLHEGVEARLRREPQQV
jgi:hypothetical protein